MDRIFGLRRRLINHTGLRGKGEGGPGRADRIPDPEEQILLNLQDLVVIGSP